MCKASKSLLVIVRMHFSFRTMTFYLTHAFTHTFVRLSLQVQKHLECFRLSPRKLQDVSAQMEKDMIRGLGKHTHHKAPVKMLPTFVRATPDGTGNYTSTSFSHEFTVELNAWRTFTH